MRKILCLLVMAALTALAAPVYRSPLALAVDAPHSLAYVAEATANSIAVFDVAKGAVNKTIALPFAPRAVVLSKDGTRLFVAGGDAKGAFAIVTIADGKVTSVPCGHTPTGLAVSADETAAFVVNRFSNSVTRVAIAEAKAVATIAVGREPHDAALGDGGKKLFVMNHQPEGPANGDYIAIAIQVVDTATNAVVKRLALPNGAAVGRNICASPDGKFAYAVHALARYQLPTTQLERGWMTTNAVTVVDCAKAELVNSFLLDDVELGAANPWDIAVSADGKQLAVTSAGSSEVSLIDLAKLHERLEKAAKNEAVTSVTHSAKDVPNDLSFLVGIRQRFKAHGLGLRSVAFLNNLILTGEYFTDSVGIIDCEQPPLKRVRKISLTAEAQPMTPERKGEMLFNSADICFQQWQSCATCHPDGRADGLNWDLLNDGLGNPKQTKSLLLSHRTPPTMISGIRKDAETCVRSGIRYIQFAVRPDDDAKAIDAYCRDMKPVESPFLVDGKLSEAAKRGQVVYQQAGCAICHPVNDLMTDLKQYDLGMQDPMDKGKAWDTPTIVECWRTAPYLFDGRAATMMEMLTKYNPNDVHGKTSKLTPQQLQDLEVFIKSW